MHAESQNRHAVLVGIDQYKPPTRCLSGCVRDVTHAYEFLKSQLRVPPENITMLTAPIGSDPHSTAPGTPTKKNVIEALEKLEQEEPGAFVYFHYSGHGAQRNTKYDLKKGQQDETICTWQEEITDVQLGNLLERLAKTHTVLAVLDSCHSGGADREELDPDDEDIRSANHTNPGLANRGIEGDADDRTAHPDYTSPLYRDRNYNLIAACHPNEKAKECLFPAKTGVRRGALSYFLLQALKQLSNANDPVTYRHLQEVMVSQMKADPRLLQNPLRLGKQDRIVFATGILAAKSRGQANVISKSRDYVTLNRGSSLQVAKGDKFLLYPPSQTTLGLITADDSSGIEVQITTVDQFTSTAVLVRDSHSSLNIVESGWFARLSTRSSRKIVHVQLPPGDGSTALDHLRDFRESPGSPFELKFTAPDEDADFTVQIDEDDNFALQDKARRPMTNLPLISAYDDTSVKQLTGLLDHLSSYQLLVDMAAPLGQSLPYTFRLEKTGRNQLKPHSLDGWRLCFKNNSPLTLYVTILGLSPAYGISEMYPGLFESSSELAKGKRISPDVIVDIVIPPLLSTAKDEPCFRMSDRFKVLVTREPVNFEDYLLPDLNKDPAELEVGKSRAEPRAPQFSPWDVHDAEIITQRLDDGSFITYDASNPPDGI
ncbi:hypothetical protein CDV31_011703 [Fusarium ambrosium]|uniref:Peptidase C14 caspase domain-containing protein n=1 Tax=Fusarium ambrosium TaxID=131363 RepID=A0A428TF25_9HYPO|nr:hypothetical protein CDV31_011703 [Fusarium ambrosium]